MISASMQDFPLTLHHILWRLEKLFGCKTVVSRRESDVHRYTYGEALARIGQCANALRRLGVQPGDRVATLAWNNFRHLELYYAVPCMGAVVHTLNLRLFPDQLQFVVEDAGDTVICVDRSLLPVLERIAGRIPSVRHIVVLDDDRGADLPRSPLGQLLDCETLLAAESPAFAWPAVDERAAAAMCYTSGTTGDPKGVVYSHRSQVLHAMGCLQRGSFGIDEDDIVLPIVPMFHANCWGLPYAAGLAGASLIFPDRFMGDASVVLDLAEREHVTVLAGVPTIWINALAALERTGKRLSEVRIVLCGGSAIPRALMEGMDQAGLRLLHAWGMTETSPIGTIAAPRTWHAADEHLKRRLMQGPAAPGVELRIADLATGDELPWDGEAFGEVQVRGLWIASGYHHQAQPDRLTEDGWFRTGDVATVDPDGFLTIVDRTKDVIKSGGEWISSVELENTIMAHPSVSEAAVVGVSHPVWQERPLAFVVARPDRALDAIEIRAFLEDRVPRWWLPDDVRFIPEMPKTSVGKFDKKALRTMAESPD
jgi:fatty-acyl-CoA synthase